MVRHFKWTDKEIREWAYEYIDNGGTTLIKLEKKLGVSHSTLWWCFKHRLHNKALSARVLKLLAKNKHNGGRR